MPILLDVILLLGLFLFCLFGVWFGFFRALGGLLGAVIGTVAAARGYEPLANMLTLKFDMPVAMRFVAFLIIFFIIDRCIAFAFAAISKTAKTVTRLPVLGMLDRIAGGCVALIEGTLILGVVILMASRLPINEWFTGQLSSSFMVPWLTGAVLQLGFLLPASLRDMGSQLPPML